MALTESCRENNADLQASVQDLLNEAVRLHQSQKLPEAERLYRRILEIDPDNADCHHLLGLICFNAGNKDAAASLIGKAIELRGDIHTYHHSLGNVLAAAGKIDEAEVCYSRAVKMNPGNAFAQNNLGVCLLLKGKADEALQRFEKAIELQPDLPDPWNGRGRVFMGRKLYHEAAASFRRAIELNPDYAEAHNNLGTAIRSLADIEAASSESAEKIRARDEEALAHYQKAAAVRPDLAEAHYNIGILLKEAGEFEKAESAFRLSVSLDPGRADAHWNLSLVLLTLGDMKNGWREYEWRWRRSGAVMHRFASMPLWDGRRFEGGTLLLHCEQGFGDNLHFIRYAPMAKERGGRVVLACYEPLRRLFKSVEGIDEIISFDGPFPQCDFQAPILSLPAIFGTTLETIPCKVPYLTAPHEEKEAWKERLRPYTGPKIGLVWSGNTSAEIAGARAIYRRRSIRLDQLAPLVRANRGINWFSLQKDDPGRQTENPPPGVQITGLMHHVSDFADTAAFIANLDMVIGIDTSVIHLAGALGKPVWVLSPFDGCWRYMLNRSGSPWYPTMRIFRQPASREWETVIDEVIGEFARLGFPS